MSKDEFETYVALMGKLLQLTPEQREQISGELQDHLQLRVADLVEEGVAKPDAVKQAVEEFGDAAVMAKNFQLVLKLKRRRWMMRFATISIAGAFLAAVLTMAMWPDNARFGSPGKSMAQVEENAEALKSNPAVVEEDESAWASESTQRTRHAEEVLMQNISFDFDETPFHEIEEQLERQTGLNFLLHMSAQDDSLTDDEPVTFKLKNMPLNKALTMMLEAKNSTYVIDDGVIVIISLDDAEDVRWFRLKMYDCRELVKVLPKTGGGGGGSGGGGFSGGGKGGGLFAVPNQGLGGSGGATAPSTTKQNDSDLLDQKLEKIIQLMRAQAEKDTPPPTAENTLIDLVQDMIQPDTWQDTGQGLGTIDVVNGILVVAQTEKILREIDNFVTDLEGHILGKRKNGKKIKLGSTSLREVVNPLRSSQVKADPFKTAKMDPGSPSNPFGDDGGNVDPFKSAKVDPDNPFGNGGDVEDDPFK